MRGRLGRTVGSLPPRQSVTSGSGKTPYTPGGIDVSVADGGSGASDVPTAQANLGIGKALLETAAFTNALFKTIVLDAHFGLGYTSFELMIHRIVPATDAVSLDLTASSDSGGTFAAAGYQWTYNGHQDGVAVQGRVASQAQFKLTGENEIGNGASEGASGRIIIFAAEITYRSLMQWFMASVTADGNMDDNVGMGMIDSPADITDIKIAFSIGNIAGGSYSLYGLR